MNENAKRAQIRLVELTAATPPTALKGMPYVP